MATAPTPIRDRQLTLPRFEGYTVPRARLAFGGGLDMSLTSPDDVELVKALSLGAKVKATIEVEGHDVPIVLDGRCTGRGHRMRNQEESESIVSTHRIVLNDIREGDDEDDED